MNAHPSPDGISLRPQTGCQVASYDHTMQIIVAEKKRVLFVCIENSNRSQLAEAFARIHAGTDVEAYSAASRPSGQINPKAIESMRELGYDLSQHGSKSLSDRFRMSNTILS